MSLSEPPTPMHEAAPSSSEHFDVASDKWFAIGSCEELDNGRTAKPIKRRGNPIEDHRRHALKEKREEIRKFLKAHPNDLHLHLDRLRQFATSNGGLVEDAFRAKIWPVLAKNLYRKDETAAAAFDDTNSIDSDFESALSEISEGVEGGEEQSTFDGPDEELQLHPEYNQVNLDVQRTLARFPPNITETHRTDLQEQLTPLIVRVLKTNRRYRYYQGFHDVCLTVLLVCGVEDAYRICVLLAKNGPFNAYLLRTLEQSVLQELDLMYVILSRVEPRVERVMRQIQLGSLFALSWPLTWFSHSLRHYQQIVRFFDMFLASTPLLPIYACAAIVVLRKDEIMACERDMPYVHRLLSEMRSEFNLDAVLSDSRYLTALIPPSLLRTKFHEQYKENISVSPQPKMAPLPRYSLQLLFVAGTVSAAAGYYFLNRLGGIL